MKKIGIIGLGMMGRGIGINLLKAGFPLSFLQRSAKSSQDDVIAQGAKPLSSITEVTKSSDVILLCLTGSAQVEEVIFGVDGVLAHLLPGSILIDLSTAIPESTLKVAQAIHDAGGFYLDSPMTRTPKEALEGRLNVLVGGDPDLLEQCRPILKCFTENIVYAGPLSSGHRLKLIHNFVALGYASVLAEAAACANLANVDSRVLLQVLETGAGNGAILNRMKGFIQSGDDASFQFTLENAVKDLGYYSAMVGELGAFSVAADATQKIYEYAIQTENAGATVPWLVSALNKTR